MSNPYKKQQSSRKKNVKVSAKIKQIAPTYSLDINNKLWFRIFMILSGVVLFALLFVATRSGVTGDEFIDSHHGKYSLQYYTEGDTTFTNYANVSEVNNVFHQKYYGIGYEILPAIAVKYLGLSRHEYLIRHLLCALFGFVFMLFAALTARELKNSFLACITLLIMALTPVVFGLSMFATKDIPSAAGYAIAVFAFVRILKKLPRFKWQDVIMAIAGIALATSVRIGGLLLIGYLGVGVMFALMIKKQLRKNLFNKPYAPLGRVILILSGIVIAGVFLGLCLYPNFFYEGPVMHIKNALSTMTNFPYRILMLWKGKQINSLELPDGYLLKSFLITIPVFVLGAFFLFFCNIRSVWKTMDKTSILLLLFTIFFPIAYVLHKDSSLYNGWRHITFIYSSFAVVAAMGIYQTLFWVKRGKYVKIWRYAFGGTIMIMMATVLVWMVRNYRYTYSYYNVFVSEPYGNYDLDYYETAAIVSLDWLVKNELQNRDDTVKIAVRNANAVFYAASKQYEKLKMEKISYRGFAEVDVDYAILTMQFTPINVLKTSFPPKGVIHTESINGKPVCAVVKKNKLDTRGIRALKENKIDEGMKLLEEARAFDPTNFGIWFWMGYGYFQQQKYDESILFLNSYIDFWPYPEQVGFAKMYIGAAQVNLQKIDAGIKTLKEATPLISDEKNKKFIDAHLGIAYFNQQNYAQAINHMKNAVDMYPFLNGLIAQSYSAMGASR
ncbi:MAG: glycosyltransferase family 39 protein [Bacteroidales bacterium]|jgi:tetratricopeptide (TPR) repeat protein|nr:glycosyltransferase family 39 protein [Bacteroidales bacterium]